MNAITVISITVVGLGLGVGIYFEATKLWNKYNGRIPPKL